MECKLRCVNVRRVSDPWRVFLPPFNVTGSAGDKPGRTDDEPAGTWERRHHVWEDLESQ